LLLLARLRLDPVEVVFKCTDSVGPNCVFTFAMKPLRALESLEKALCAPDLNRPVGPALD
jgi:hypothetical protein